MGDKISEFRFDMDDATAWLNPIDAKIISYLPQVVELQEIFLEIGVFRGGLVRTFLENNPS